MTVKQLMDLPLGSIIHWRGGLDGDYLIKVEQTSTRINWVTEIGVSLHTTLLVGPDYEHNNLEVIP